MLIFEGFVWIFLFFFFWKLQFYICGCTTKSTDVTLFKDSVSCPSGGPKFMNIAMYSSFIFSQLSLKSFLPV